MPVSPSYRAYALEQLGQVAPIADRAMFGGVGLYCGGLFFALMDDDRLYFKVDDSNRPDYEAVGMGPFMPFGDESHVMQYYEVPAAVLEDAERLAEWVEKAVQVAAAKQAKQRRSRRGP